MFLFVDLVIIRIDNPSSTLRQYITANGVPIVKLRKLPLFRGFMFGFATDRRFTVFYVDLHSDTNQ